MTKVAVSVLGAGSWAVGSHLANLRQSGRDVEFRGVCRLDAEKLKAIKEAYGFRYASEDYRDVLERGADVVIVASPAAYHYEHAAAALERGAHVLVEKPFTLRADEAWELAESGERARLAIVVAFGWNYFELADRARNIIVSGGIGAIEAVSVTMSSAMRELLAGEGSAYELSSSEVVPEPRTWADPALAGGGYGQAQLSHALGLVLWLTDLRGQEVSAMMGGGPVSGIEYHDAIIVRFESGAVGSVFGGSRQRTAAGNSHYLVVLVLGSNGWLELDIVRGSIVHSDGQGRAARIRLQGSPRSYDCRGPLEAVINAAAGQPFRNNSPAELGARTVEILEAAYQQKRVVIVPDRRANPPRANHKTRARRSSEN